MKKKRSVMAIILFIILSAFGSVIYVNSLLNKIDHDVEHVATSGPGISVGSEKNQPQYHDKVTNIVLFGLDYVKEDKGRSDTIIIFTIDETHNMLKLTSIMRDSYVIINGHGKDKINHAYAFGGPQLAIKTINENFDLNITKYAAVSFNDFSAIIDRLGGVEIKVTDEEVSEIPGLEKGGTYNLNGTQALAYSRIRCLSGGDYERTLRQRTLIKELYKKLLSGGVTQYPDIAAEIFPLIHTNLTNSEIINYCTYIAFFKPTLKHDRFPKDDASSGQKIDGVYYLVFQEQKTIDAIHQFIFESAS